MDKMSFREGQLLVLATIYEATGKKAEYVPLNNEQVFSIGDCAEVTEIRLDSPHINICVADGTNSYCHIDNFSDKVIDECVEILRGVAAYHDWTNHKDNIEAIKSNNNPRV